ncbi:hypothetical protein [Methylobacterium sp. A54F]
MDEDPEGNDERHSAALLAQIADILRLDPAHFFAALPPGAEAGGETLGGQGPSATETDELLRLFNALNEPAARRSAIEAVRRCRQDQDPEPEG